MVLLDSFPSSLRSKNVELTPPWDLLFLPLPLLEQCKLSATRLLISCSASRRAAAINVPCVDSQELQYR